MALPKYELERLEALRRCNILDTFPEVAFDEVTFLAAQVCRAPVALVVMVDEERCWFKSKLGLDLDEVHHFSLCAHAISESEIFTVRDAQKDHRFSHDPLVATDPKIRFYAGTPLLTPDGFAVGTLCVMDYVPRTLSKDQLNALSILGHQGSRLIALRHKDASRTFLGSTFPWWTELMDSDNVFLSQALRGFTPKKFAVETEASCNFALPSETPVESRNDFIPSSDADKAGTTERPRSSPGETLS